MVNRKEAHDKKDAGWSKGNKKLLAFAKDLVRRKSFIADLERARRQLKIPENGLTSRESDFLGTLPIPSGFSAGQKVDLPMVCEWLGIEHNLGPLAYSKVFLPALVLYDKIHIDDRDDLCLVQDIPRTDPSKKMMLDKIYPISIRIDPSASLNDILSFLHTNFKKRIQPLQMIYKRRPSKIGKKRTRKDISMEISDFVADHEKLKSSELLREFSMKFGAIKDPGELQKIRSLEKKRRK